MTGDATALPLVPFPAHLAGASPCRLSDTSAIVGPEGVEREAELLAAALRARTGLPFPVVVSGTANEGDVVIGLVPGDEDESYTLTTDGGVRISASTPAGAHWAAQTLRQLVAQDEDGWFVRGATIRDEPRFAYRGVMLDVARHFFSVADVCRYIDLVNALKINVIHLHLTDDQGWRLEIAGYPNLTGRAAESAALGDPGGFYTQEQFREIVDYAAERHMTLVPEIDTPGHTHAVTVAYPEFTRESVLVDSVVETAELFDQTLPVHGEPYQGWSVGFSSLKIGDAPTDEFVAEVFGQVASLIRGPWVHLGGDEALGTSDEDFATFVRTASSAIAATGKTPIAWHEAGRVEGLPTGMIGQYWGYRVPQPGFDEAARAFPANGGSLVLSPADAAYLDMKFAAEHPLGLTWADGPTSVESSYAWDPADVIPGVGESEILGVEAPMWAETLRTIADVETMAFPRVAGIAEIAWTPRTSPARDWTSVRERIGALGPVWQADGIRFHPSEEIPWS